ncbi:receptor-like protein kinase [Musa troglodytarum]|uniref:Receptor-like protein kinase n=1 Tax=Musa troglodytarum TaxID=320322 RepID=A0A9E7ESJ1_9LILI|nr:receptor-like protein kinase [Musa troglodytarum]
MDLRILAFLLPLFLPSALFVSTTAFNPETSYYLNCGSASDIVITTDVPSRKFTDDARFLSDSAKYPSLSNPSVAASSPSLYSTARVFTSSASYSFPINSSGTYVLRLHFFPFSGDRYNLSSARFGVNALQRFGLLEDFSAPTSTAPTIKEYFLWVDSHELDVTFAPSPTSSSSFAFVNAVEVFTAPTNLIKDEDSRLDIDQLSRQALETVHRINMGGPGVNDSLWRTWIADDDYLLDEFATLVKRTDPLKISYQQNETDDVAPRTVYSTARTMNISSSVRAIPNFNFNVTWSFPVVAGYKYLVRAHFCDFISQGFSTDIRFDLYVGNLRVQEIQGSAHVEHLAQAFHIDSDLEGPSSGTINISIGRDVARITQSNANAMLNGLEIFKVNNTSGSLGGTSNLPSNSSNGVPIAAVVGAAVGGVLLVSLLIVCVLVFFIRKRRRSKPLPLLPNESWSPFRETPRGNSVGRSSKSTEGTALAASLRVNLGLYIPLLDIKAATNDFDESLVVGSGGFGKVYRGVLADGTKIAVKRAMPGSKQGFPEFQTEILVLSGIRHRHLVALIGYCEEQSERLLVYEYMEKGTLRNYLYGSDKPCLSWKQRLEICIGAARGLHYLHTGYSHTIIHRDIKSTNILLDENYLAKVSDFGLSKLGPSFGETHVTTGVKGTFGYFDPEYFKTQKLTDKSDVYSFGVMLFEVLCARPVIDRSLSMEQLNLAEWALHWQRRGQLEKIIDQRLVGKINTNSLRKFGETAEKCVAEYGIDRPAFADILWNLEYALQLHVTELKREPHEDSGAVESQISVAAMRDVDSAGLNVDEANDRSRMTSEGQSDLTASIVFSQLVTDEGR